MIIYGTRGRKVPIGNGNFHCPRCDTPRNFAHYDVRRYFTLYFIPLIPIGSAGQYIECAVCQGTFEPEVMNYDPVVERKKLIDTCRRLGILFLIETSNVTVGMLQALQTELEDMFDVDVDREEIAADVRHAQQASPNVLAFFKSSADVFSDDGKLMLVRRMKKIADSQGAMPDGVRDKLLLLATKGLGVRQKQVKAILDEVQ